MYVTKRPFRNSGKVFVAGEVITEPATIKHFNARLAEGKIIEVNEHNFDTYASYFKAKFGVELKQPSKPEVTKSDDVKPATKPVAKTTSTVTPKVTSK